MWRTRAPSGPRGSALGLCLLVLMPLRGGDPALLPGEGLALAAPGGSVRVYGEADRVGPMGSLAKLIWLSREGATWERQGVTFTCRGLWRGWSCWNHEGHGPLDLGGAARASCNLAFLAWAEASLSARSREQGPSAARAALETDFGPFLGDRLAPSEALPRLGPAWVGGADLLRTSPRSFLAWLGEPARAGLRAQCMRLLPDRLGWWVKTGTAAIPGHPEETCAWVAGGCGEALAVLRVPRGRGKAEGLARFRALVEEAGP